ncbi:MAG TPA: hypothetical protein VN426_07865 [Syntrophomonadaceae bacterium]|nr:hypothetical protein [Syntrophomonadaceae bacterium]
MEGKNPPEALLELAREEMGAEAGNMKWKYKKTFHFACAPWMAPCFHLDTQTYATAYRA